MRLMFALMRLLVIIVVATAIWYIMPEDVEVVASLAPLTCNLLPILVIGIMTNAGDQFGRSKPEDQATVVVEMMAIVIGLSPAAYMAFVALAGVYAREGVHGCLGWFGGPGLFFLIVGVLMVVAFLILVLQLALLAEAIQNERRAIPVAGPVEQVRSIRYTLLLGAVLALAGSSLLYVGWLDDRVVNLDLAPTGVKYALASLFATFVLKRVERWWERRPNLTGLLPAEVR